MTNEDLELKNTLGNKTMQKRRLKNLVNTLGYLNIPLSQLNDPSLDIDPIFQRALGQTDATFFDLVIAKQFAKAICDGDTRSAEFLRDTAGEKPSTSVELTETRGIAEMSTEELERHLAYLEAQTNTQALVLDKGENK